MDSTIFELCMIFNPIMFASVSQHVSCVSAATKIHFMIYHIFMANKNCLFEVPKCITGFNCLIFFYVKN